MLTAIGVSLLFVPLLTVLALIGYVYLYVRRNHLSSLERIFVEKPLFVIPRGEVDPAAEEVRFPTANGMMLQGAYFRSHRPTRKGVILFGIEYGADRWSCRSYCDPLLDAGYDVFTYEPRNQGKSDVIPDYVPLQWITEHEVQDARAALKYLLSRPDADPKGVGVFGVSKGANAGMALMSEAKQVRCGVTDGAFGLLSVMLPYMRHWIGIYNRRYLVHGLMPAWFYAHIARIGMKRVQRERKIRFYHLEQRARRIRQPLLMIHGEADSYIKQEMARTLFRAAAGPKEFWAVAGARHNQSVTVAGEEFARRVVAFFDDHLK